MSKQEEIREGIAKTVCLWHIGEVGMWEAGEDSIRWEGPPKKDYYEAADMIMKDEDSQGVVIKAEDQTIQVELPADGKPTGLKLPYHLSNLGENIAAVEPLIGVNG